MIQDAVISLLAKMLGITEERMETPYCHLTDPVMLDLIMRGDFVTGICYLIIPACILLFVALTWSRTPLAHKLFLLLVAGFVASSGMSHLVRVVTVTYPNAFHFEAQALWIASALGVITVLALPIIGTAEYRQPTRLDYQKRIDSLTEAIIRSHERRRDKNV